MTDSPLKDTNIPQLSYDIIARILPGFFALAAVVFSSTIFTQVSEKAGDEAVTSYKLLILGMTELNVGLFDTIAFLILSYLLGWIFYRPSTKLRQIALDESVKQLKEGEPGHREMYNYLRVTRMAAGQRLLKLRAEVRMWEALRHARPWTILLATILIILSWYISDELTGGGSPRALILANAAWTFLKAVIILVVFLLSPLRTDNIEKLWKRYWDDIVLHYRLVKEIQNNN